LKRFRFTRKTRLLAAALSSAALLAIAAAAHAQESAKPAHGEAPASRSQQTGKVLRDAIKASGGAKILTKVRTITLEGSVAASGSEPSGTFTLNVKLPNRYYMELVSGNRSFIDSFNGKSAWRQNAAGEISTLVGPESLQLEAAAHYYNSHVVNLRHDKLVVTYVGTSQVRGRDAIELDIASLEGAKRQVFFDAQTHLIAEEAASMGGIDQKLFYDDYRPSDGLQLPYKITLVRGSDTFEIQIARAVVNEQIGERVFDFPRKSQVVLPDLKKLFAEVREREAANEKLRQKYAGTEIETETDIDKKGSSTKTEVTESAFFYLNGSEVDRVLKRDGQPLNAAERKAEDERVAKQVAELRKPPPAKPAQGSTATSKGDQPASSGTRPDSAKSDTDDANRSDDDVKDSDFSIDTFLRVAQFVNPRRERYQGQDVLAFDFEPNPEYKAHGLVEKIVQKLGGVIWIDERAHDVVRLDAFFVSDMKIAGGLVADLEKDSRVIIMNTYVNNEVWLPEYEEVNVGLRLLLVKTFRIEESTKYFDYRKFDPSVIEAFTAK
jgi:hypothetical protein